MGIVYLLKSDNGDRDLYKIGITKYKKANKRLSQLQTGNGNQIVIIKTFESEFNSKIERALHAIHIVKRYKGEWFELTNEDVKNFIGQCQQLHDNFELLTNSENPFI